MYDLGQALAAMAEVKILEAIRNGEFDNLPGQGKPLELEDLSMVPETLRMGYILLKNAGLLPEELAINKEMATLERLIAACTLEEEKQKLRQKLGEKTLLYNILMEKRRKSARFSR